MRAVLMMVTNVVESKRFRWRSLSATMWSRRSRLQLPTHRSATPTLGCVGFLVNYGLTHYSESDIPESGISNYDHETRYKSIRSLIARRIPYPARACRRRTSWLRNHAGDSSAVGGKIPTRSRHALRQPATTDGKRPD